MNEQISSQKKKKKKWYTKQHSELYVGYISWDNKIFFNRNQCKQCKQNRTDMLHLFIKQLIVIFSKNFRRDIFISYTYKTWCAYRKFHCMTFQSIFAFCFQLNMLILIHLNCKKNIIFSNESTNTFDRNEILFQLKERRNSLLTIFSSIYCHFEWKKFETNS